jgi:predicted  nucleic acid-binding Zn-ribbon protein
VLEGLQQLIELQGLDDEITALEVEHAGVPARRSDFHQQRVDCEEKIARFSEALRAGEHEQREAEARLQDQEALLQRLEGQQFQVKSNDAYTALLHEMEHAKRAISDCETRILESMDTIETARSERTAAEAEASATGARLETEERALDEREKQLEKELGRARARRDDIRTHIEADLLSRYTKIAARRQPAVVVISDEMCLGCRVNIPPQSYIEILKAERVITCGQCQRILVHRAKLPPAAER